MPTYDYKCRSCNESFSTREKISDHESAHAVCPKCKSADVERQISGFYARTPRKS